MYNVTTRTIRNCMILNGKPNIFLDNYYNNHYYFIIINFLAIDKIINSPLMVTKPSMFGDHQY